MNTELFIARRLYSSKDQNQRLSRRIVRLAVAGITLGMVAMILAVSIVTGFQQEVKNKVNGFTAHLQVIDYDSNQSFQTEPVEENESLLAGMKEIPGVRHVQVFATKPGIIKADEDIQGVILNGISTDFDWTFFENSMIEGERIRLDSARSDNVWISEQISNLLKLGLGDQFRMYFLNEDENFPRIRQFTVCGIYRTGLEEFDKMFVLCDIRQVQSLNSWEDNQVSGYEIFLNDINDVDRVFYQVNDLLISFIDVDSPLLRVVDIRDKYPYIFDWLDLLDMNVWIILILMVLVAGFNMISGLLVIILERTRMIGILKSMGAANVNVRKVFLYLSAFLIGEGLLWGNLLGISIGLIQHYFKILHLDPTSYYVDTVPVNLVFSHLVFLNIGALLVTLLMLLGPSYIVGRISPEKTIRFE